ncbi:AMP-binding protein [Microbacteriaceae bacterium VKM Ac-2854]|nr:AMP-binding protein [Microbacteriaceae bacterium VKM Ac-2854]
MTRELVAIDGADASAVSRALRAALDGSGPAVRVASDPLTSTVARRIALVVETSGSSGEPKRVALSSTALLTSAAATEAALGGPGQWLLCLPTHYIAGAQVLVRSITAGTDPVVLPAGHFDAAAFVRAARGLDGDRRYVSLVPVQLARLLDLAEADAASAAVLRRFDGVLVGGQATPLPLRERAAALGVTVRLSYGSSETAGGCVYDGIPIGSTRVRIDAGQVLLGGEVLAEGYLDADYALDVERTANAFPEEHGERWYRTGDAGGFEAGTVSISGRMDRVIISGGEKVSLDAVERVVRELGATDAVAVRAADPQWGEVPVVFSASALELAALRGAVAERLGRAAAPSAAVRREIPLLESGKPDRRALERLLATGGQPHAGRHSATG